MYGIPTLPVDKRTGKVIQGAPPVVGYIGKSVQTVWERQEQHRADQPFSDTICGGSWVIEEGFWTAAELDAREQFWIRNGVALVPGQKPQRPVYNYEFNLDNPDRIEVWRAKEHRQAREPGWQPQNPRVPQQRNPRPGQRPSRPAQRRPPVWLSRWWRRNRARVVGWTLLWVAAVAGVWWLGSGYWEGWDEPRNGVVLGTIGWISVWWPRRRKRRRRRRR